MKFNRVYGRVPVYDNIEGNVRNLRSIKNVQLTCTECFMYFMLSMRCSVSPLERQKREGVTPTAFISNDGITLTTEETEIIESTSLGVTPTTTLPEVIPTTTLPDIISTTTLLDVIPTTNATVDNSTTEELVSAMTSVVPVTTSSVSTSPTTSSVSTSPTTSSVSTSPTSNIATLDREDHSGQAAGEKADFFCQLLFRR